MAISFKESLKIVPSEQEEKKRMELDAYKKFISEAIPGYISFMEALNYTINELQEKGIIGKVKLRTRLKAINSALINTQKKILDDVFGFELITENERDKEILMLLIHNLFVDKYARHKNFNKSNGYYAHHCTGAVKMNLNGAEAEELESHILTAETSELKTQFRDLSRKEQSQYKKEEIYCKKPRYPILRQEILNEGQIDNKLKQDFEEILSFLNQCLPEDAFERKNMPVFEIQFKTLEVEQETSCGRAQHVKYKNVNEEEITKKYFQRKLSRGVDFPFIFVRNKKGELEIQHTSDTLISMWPFLEDAIIRYHQMYSCPVANYDSYFAKVFPALEPYVEKNLSKEPSMPIGCFDEEMAWSVLRNKIINDTFILPHSDEVLKVVGRN